MSLRFDYCDLSNVSISVDSNGLHISGTINTNVFKQEDQSTTQAITILYRKRLFNQKLITFTADASGDISSFIGTPDLWQSRIQYYRNSFVVIDGYTGTSNFAPAYGFRIKEGSSFSIHIKTLCLYEGAFTNPPIYKSLDVQPSNQFALKYLYIPYARPVTRRGSGKWTTIAKIASTNAYGNVDYFICANRSSMFTAMIHIRVASDNGFFYIKTMYVDGASRVTTWLSKIRISLYEGSYYLDVLEGNSTSFEYIVVTSQVIWTASGSMDVFMNNITHNPSNNIADSATSKYVLDNPWTIA